MVVVLVLVVKTMMVLEEKEGPSDNTYGHATLGSMTLLMPMKVLIIAMKMMTTRR